MLWELDIFYRFVTFLFAFAMMLPICIVVSYLAYKHRKHTSHMLAFKFAFLVLFVLTVGIRALAETISNVTFFYFALGGFCAGLCGLIIGKRISTYPYNDWMYLLILYVTILFTFLSRMIWG